MGLIENLIKQGWLKTPRIIKAFQDIKRIDFLPEEAKNLAEIDEALSIGFSQTISQPLVVAFMLEQLCPEVGDKILDIGSGSGWTTALLSYIATDNKQINGKVIAIELVPELMEFGKKNVSKYSFLERGTANFICADGSKGYPSEAPVDRILVSAAGENIPQEWKDQLKIGGKIVAPVSHSIWVLTKISETEFEKVEHSGFVFVPLVRNGNKG